MEESYFLKIGEKIKVRVKGVDDLGRINLSMILDPAADKRRETARRQERRSTRPSNRYNRRRRERTHTGRRTRDRASGPHFPTSRLLDENKNKFSR